MRALFAFAAWLLLPFTAAAAAAAAERPPGEERYVPAEGWRDLRDAAFYERWIGNQLSAMDEPILARPSDLGRFRSRFRLLVLPNSDPAWALRIDERSTGAAIVTFVELDGAGGYAPGNVARRRGSTIDRDDVAALRRQLRRSRFSELPRLGAPDSSERCDEAGCTVTLCVHGTLLVFERLDRSGRQFVQRSSCNVTPELNALLRTLNPLREF